MRKITHIVLHTAGSAVKVSPGMKVVHQEYQTIIDYHVNHNGWRTGGYNRYITEDGTTVNGRPDSQQGAHTRGFNANTLGLCVSGHGDYEPWNDKQEGAVVDQCAAWCTEYEIGAKCILGHRETEKVSGYPVSKTCPGLLVDMNRIRGLVQDRLEYNSISIAAPSKRTLEELERLTVYAIGLEDRVAALERKAQALPGEVTRDVNGSQMFDVSGLDSAENPVFRTKF